MFLFYLVTLFVLTRVKCETVSNNNTSNGTIVSHRVSLNASERNFNSVCGDIYSKKEFVIESPNYPNSYPKNLDCSYLIKGPYCPTYFQFQFIDFNIEKSVGCVKDRLEIDNIDALCGSRDGIKNYFSKTGAIQVNFKTDENGSGRGYKIFVARFPCNINPDESQYEESIPITTLRPQFIPNNPNLFPNEETQHCCHNTYQSKNMVLISPNFPKSLNYPNDCIFKITRQNNQVCRLRIEVLYFNFGIQLYDQCAEGFIEIDGKLICGCKQNLKLISSFRENEPFKIIKFRSEGRGREFYTGFVLKLSQDECPKRYKPEMLATFNDSNRYHYLNDQINRVAWPKDNKISLNQRINLINERTEILDDNDKTVNNVEPNVVKHFYFYSYPEESKYNYPIKEPEESTYIYTNNINNVLPDTTNFEYCNEWNNYQLKSLYSSYNENSLKCQTEDNANHLTPSESTRCIELNYARGYFRSPGYPFFYPDNVNMCYRIRKQPGFCAIKVYVNDFQIESSPDCQNGYLSWTNSQRYCGNSLHKTFSNFDVTNNDYIEAKFVTNKRNFYCGRGFFGVYEQLACQDMNYPINPVTPPYEPPTIKPSVPCDRVYQLENFVIEVYGYNRDACMMTIQASHFDVCEVILTFEIFDLDCTLAMLTIDGNQYCGQLTGKSVRLRLNNGVKNLIYRRLLTRTRATNLEFRLRVQQQRHSCPEVEPQRLMIPTPKSLNNSQKGTPFIDAESNFLFSVTRQNNIKHLCGILTNTKENKLPDAICDVLIQQHNVTKCVPVAEYNKFAVKNTQNITLEIGNKTEDLPYHEIDCDDIMKI